MKAIFDFIPAYCPNCGRRLFDADRAEYLTTLGATLEDYHAGQPFTCDCGLAFEKAQPVQTVIMPLGWLSGKEIPTLAALQHLESTILGHASDLEHFADSVEPAYGATEVERAKAQTDKEGAERAAGYLRLYGWALWLINWQLLTTEGKAASVVDRQDLAELAQRYNLVLPGDLTAGEEPTHE